MAKLISVFFDNFETYDDGAALKHGPAGWAGNADPFLGWISITNPIEGLKSVQLMGYSAANTDTKYILRGLFAPPITAMELRFKYRCAATGYTKVQNKPVYIWVENNVADYPWAVQIHKNAVEFEDNTGYHDVGFDPGTSVAHDYQVIDDGAGNVVFKIDGATEWTGTSRTMTPNDVTRVGIWHAQDPLNTGYNIITGHLDCMNVLQSVSSTFNLARLLVGK